MAQRRSTDENPFAMAPVGKPTPMASIPRKPRGASLRSSAGTSSGALDAAKAAVDAVKAIAKAADAYFQYRGEVERTKQARARARAERQKIAAWRDVSLVELKNARVSAKASAGQRAKVLAVVERSLRAQEKMLNADRAWLRSVLKSKDTAADQLRKAQVLERRLAEAHDRYVKLLSALT